MVMVATWVTSGEYTNPMATTTVVGAAVIEWGRLVGVLVTAAGGVAAAIRSGTAPPAYPAVPMAVAAVPMAVAAGLTAAGDITKVHSTGANHDIRH
jgi:hypothetical protein